MNNIFLENRKKMFNFATKKLKRITIIHRNHIVENETKRVMTRCRIIKTTLLSILLMAFGSTTVLGQEKKQAQDIDWMKEITSRVTLNGYAQGGYSWQDMQGKKNNEFNLKRTLLWAKARITDRWSFLFMHDFSSVVQEFYTDYRFSKGTELTVRLGQFKHSFTIENPLSPTVLELVDVYSQSVLFLAGEGPDPLHGVNYGRDMGLMVFGDLFQEKIHYEFSVMNGQGVNKHDGNKQKDLIGRLEYKPMKELRLVVSGQLGTGHALDTAAWNPTVKKGQDYKRNRISAGAEWKSGSYAPGKYKEGRPISLRGEILEGRDGDVISQGAYLTACVPCWQGIDVVASADYFDRNTDMDYYQTQLTAGLQYWFYKKCRIQLQYTRTFSHFQRDYNWLQAQMQVAF